VAAAAAVLGGRGQRSWFRRLWPFLGPAFVASVAYIDPGNFATNIQGGARFGYMLLWVVVASNLMAMLVQALSAKLGIATGMEGRTICVFADAAAWPVQSYITKFRSEFEYHVREGKCDLLSEVRSQMSEIRAGYGQV
jgi:hypothetical protein